jgi:hypothetical protein
MGQFTQLPIETVEIPLSGAQGAAALQKAHDLPSVAEINNLQTEIDTLYAGQTGGVIVFATYALLDAYTPTTVDQEVSSYKVTNDSDSSLNGYYSWTSGTAYTKDAELVANVIDPNNTSEGVSGSAVAKYTTKKNPYFIRAEDFVWARGDIDSSGNFVSVGTTKIVADRYILLVAGTKITINSGYEFNLAVYDNAGTFIRFEGAAFIQEIYTIVDEYNYRAIIKRTANTTIEPADIISVSEQSQINYTARLGEVGLAVNNIDDANTTFGVSGQAVSRYVNRKTPYFIRAEDFTWALSNINSSGVPANSNTRILPNRTVYLLAGTELTVASGYEFNLAVYESDGTFIRFEGTTNYFTETHTLPSDDYYLLLIQRIDSSIIDPSDIILVSEQVHINYTARLKEAGLAVNTINDANSTFAVSGQSVARYNSKKAPYFIRAEDFVWALGNIDPSGNFVDIDTTKIVADKPAVLVTGTKITVSSGYEFNLAVYDSDGTFVRFEDTVGFITETYTIVDEYNYRLIIRRTGGSTIEPADIISVSEQVAINYTARLREVGVSVNIVDEDDADLAVSGQAVSNYVNKNSSYFVEPSDLGWVSGNIDSSGNLTNTNTRVRANKPVYLVKGTVVSMTNGHDFNIAAYDNDGVFLGFENPTGFIRTPYTIPSNGNYWMLLKRLDSSIIDNADVDFIGEQIKISYTARMRDITTTTSDAILRNGTQINDVLNYVSSSDNNMVFDPLTGFVYVVYLASETEYGESDDANVLTVFPIKQPWLATHHVVAAKGEVIDGITIGSTFGCNLLHLDTVVRVFLRLSGIYYYRDYDKATKAFLPDLTKVQLDVGSLVDFKATSINDYLVAGGYSATSDVFMIAGFQLYSGFYYTMASSFNGNPIVMKSNDDGATWELLGIIPETAEYESCLAINETTELLCVLNRNIYDDNYFTSDDLGITFNAGQEVYLSNVRPRLLNYKGEILILHSEFADVPNMYCTSGRNNFMIKSGDGANVKDFQQKVYITSRFGLVYPSIINYKNDIYSCFSSGELHHDITNQCKDALNFVRIGEFFDGEDFIINQ